MLRGQWTRSVAAGLLALAAGAAVALAQDNPPTAAACQPAELAMVQRNAGGEIVDTYVARFSELRPRFPTQSDCIWIDPRDNEEAFVAFVSFGGLNSGTIPAGDCPGTDPRPTRSDRRHLTVGGGARRIGGAAAEGDDAVLARVLAAAEASGAGPACARTVELSAPSTVSGTAPRRLRRTTRSAKSPQPGASVGATSGKLPAARRSVVAMVSGAVDDLAVLTPELSRRAREAASRDTVLTYCTLTLRSDRLAPQQVARLLARLAAGYELSALQPLTSLQSLDRLAKYCELALQRAVLEVFLPQSPLRAVAPAREPSAPATTATAATRTCRVLSFPVEIIPAGARATGARAAPRLTASCRLTAGTMQVTLRPRSPRDRLRAVAGRRVQLRVARPSVAAAPSAGARVRVAIR